MNIKCIICIFQFQIEGKKTNVRTNEIKSKSLRKYNAMMRYEWHMIHTGNERGRGGKSSQEEDPNEIKPCIKITSHVFPFLLASFCF